MKYKVYVYRFPNGKVYVGVTSLTLTERRDNGYNHNKALKREIRESGWKNIEKLTVFESDSREDAFDAEIEFISRLNSTDPEIGYNISHGGISTFSGLRHTDEYKRKMSERMTGIVFSDETLDRMREAHSKEKKAVVRTDNAGEERIFSGLKEAARDVGGYATNIARACTSDKQYKGYEWRFANERG